LSPSANGTLELAAQGSVNGLQPTGVDANTGAEVWTSSEINVSDASPSEIPGITSPFAYESLVER